MSLLVGIGATLFGGAPPGAPCPEVSSAHKSRLAHYVLKKYQVPEQANLRVEDVSPIDDSCDRRFVFMGDGALGTFRLTLYATPDLRLLSRELFNTNIDPELERSESARKAMGQLMEGEYAARGTPNAPVTMVLFSDFQCPYCKRMKELIDAEPLIRLGDSVRLVFRHMPMAQHAWAQHAAEAAACAEFQSSSVFWALHDRLFENQDTITASDASRRIDDLATGVPGVDVRGFQECLKRQMSLGTVVRDTEMGKRLGVVATPTVFLNGLQLPGVRNGAELHHYLSDALKGSGAESSR
ncbi:MAG: thioredoxin domain-containing protein [Bryobacteraceae bacterium]|jgi:protein-disulfide isomerase